MVRSIDELLQTIEANPFIDGLGYFVEVTTTRPVPLDVVTLLDDRLKRDSCEHSEATLEYENVLGLDFHDHIHLHTEEDEPVYRMLMEMLKMIENSFGIEHLCMEFQFDFQRAKIAGQEIDELLRP